ncbi:MAG: HAD hydrolase family protein, partial [Spiroplasma sp.]|nr:HAD hydrolase family protein [Mycoplasmatales bacterium]
VTASKGDAITKILTNQRNVKVYAFGDGLNDVEMFQEADVSVAMGNATKVVKEVAQFVTDDEYNDGIYNFLLKNKEIEVK